MEPYPEVSYPFGLICCIFVYYPKQIICQKMFDLKIQLKDSSIQDKKLNKATNSMLNKIISDYKEVTEKIHSKQFSTIHLYMLKTTANKIKYLKTFFEPTEEMELYTYLEARADFSIAFSLNNAIKRYDSYGSDINLFKEVMEM